MSDHMNDRQILTDFLTERAETDQGAAMRLINVLLSRMTFQELKDFAEDEYGYEASEEEEEEEEIGDPEDKADA